MSEILVRLEDGRGVITLAEPFFESDEQTNVYNEWLRYYSSLFAALFPAEAYGSLAGLGSRNITGERGNEHATK
jgi:hypothetical protein